MLDKAVRLFIRTGLAILLLFVVLMAPSAEDSQTLQEYRIGPGDKLNITVFGHPDLSVIALVDGAGRISLPLIGQIPANSKTIIQLQEEITTALNRDYIINPRINLEVVNYRPFYILGDVNKPGSYPYIEGMTVRMAVAIAGGFKFRAEDLWGKNDTVTVFHVNDPDKRKISVEPGDLVLPGDSIEVERRLFFILGQVNKPGSYTHIEGMTVRMAVAMAGGFTRRAKEELIAVIRSQNNERITIEVDQSAEVLPGDSIEVDRRLF